MLPCSSQFLIIRLLCRVSRFLKLSFILTYFYLSFIDSVRIYWYSARYTCNLIVFDMVKRVRISDFGCFEYFHQVYNKVNYFLCLNTIYYSVSSEISLPPRLINFLGFASQLQSWSHLNHYHFMNATVSL